VFFKVPGVIFDFDSLSFQVPICGSAAKHAAAPKKQNAIVTPIALVFMHAIKSGFVVPVNVFPARQRGSEIRARFYRPRLCVGSR
jgi:hypothetical protein